MGMKVQLLGCHSKHESSSKPSSEDNILFQKYDHLSRGREETTALNKIRPPTDPPAKKKSPRLFFEASDAH